MNFEKLIFVFLKFLELYAFFYAGYRLRKPVSERKYWNIVLFPILSFTLIEGLRFGRSIDWNLYFYRYRNIGINPENEDYEWLFEGICYTFYNIGCPYWLFITIQCFFLITVIFLFIRNFKEQSYFYLIPLAFCLIVIWNENLIRWSLAFSFLILAVHFIINDKIFPAILGICASIMCHTGMCVYLPFLLFYRLINRIHIPVVISLFLLFFMNFYGSLTYFDFLVDISDFIFNKINIDTSQWSRFNSTESVLAGELGSLGIMQSKILTHIRGLIVNSIVIIFARPILFRYKYGVFIYNLYLIGAICSPVLQTVELMNRLMIVFNFFLCIAGGTCYTEILKNRSRSFIYILALISFLFSLYPYVSNVVKRSNEIEYQFLWNAKGRETISINRWIDFVEK